MTDITKGLAELGEHWTDVPSDYTVATAGEIGRGRAALRHRRLRVGSVASAAVLVIGGAAGYLSVSGHSATHQGPAASAPLKVHQGGATAASSRVHQGGAAPAPSKVRLVAYDGHQPQGFNVASIPQGFHLQTQISSAYAFVLAPPGVNTNAYNFVGKLVVTAEAASGLGHWQSAGTRWVTVHGSRGRIGNQDGATQLWFDVGHGVIVDAQAWDSIGLTDQQLINFANGVTTTPALQLGHG